jgi:hypothetical protein
MDGYAQGKKRYYTSSETKELIHVKLDSTTATAKAAIDLIDNIDSLDPNDRFMKLKAMVELLTERAQRNSEKAALAKVTSDAVKLYN